MSTRVLVTGGAGFIGSHLVKRLVSLGADVHVVDNLWRGNLDNLAGAKGEPLLDLKDKFKRIDLCDRNQCIEHIRNFDMVFHLADIVAGVDYVFSNELMIFQNNIAINTNTLAACIANKIPKYIYVGTACSYPKHLQMQDSVTTLTEDQTYPAYPESAYGWSKLMGEYEAELAMKEKLLEVAILRFHNVYGPNASYEKKRSQVIPSLIKKAIDYPSEPFVVYGNGKQYRDFIYVDDVIEALLLASEKGGNQGVIQIGSEIPTSIKCLAETVANISGKNIRIQYDESKPTGDIGRISNCERARQILGWQAKTALEEGVKRTYDWIRTDLAQKAGPSYQSMPAA